MPHSRQEVSTAARGTSGVSSSAVSQRISVHRSRPRTPIPHRSTVSLSNITRDAGTCQISPCPGISGSFPRLLVAYFTLPGGTVLLARRPGPRGRSRHRCWRPIARRRVQVIGNDPGGPVWRTGPLRGDRREAMRHHQPCLPARRCVQAPGAHGDPVKAGRNAGILPARRVAGESPNGRPAHVDHSSRGRVS